MGICFSFNKKKETLTEIRERLRAEMEVEAAERRERWKQRQLELKAQRQLSPQEMNEMFDAVMEELIPKIEETIGNEPRDFDDFLEGPIPTQKTPLSEQEKETLREKVQLSVNELFTVCAEPQPMPLPEDATEEDVTQEARARARAISGGIIGALSNKGFFKALSEADRMTVLKNTDVESFVEKAEENVDNPYYCGTDRGVQIYSM